MGLVEHDFRVIDLAFVSESDGGFNAWDGGAAVDRRQGLHRIVIRQLCRGLIRGTSINSTAEPEYKVGLHPPPGPRSTLLGNRYHGYCLQPYPALVEVQAPCFPGQFCRGNVNSTYAMWSTHL